MIGRIGSSLKREFTHIQGKDVLAGDKVENEAPVRLVSQQEDRRSVSPGTLAWWGLGGAAVGAVGGAIGGGLMAREAIMNVPKESVTLEWEVPRWRDVEIGRIPEDRYVRDYGWWWGSDTIRQGEAAEVVPVVRSRPVIGADGEVVMDPVKKTFTDHGKPVVEWKNRAISDPEMTGYNQRIIPDRHTHYESYTDSDGDTHTRTTEHIHGYWIRYEPIIRYHNVGYYKEPVVNFDHGVDVAGYVLRGALIGAGLGAVSGAILGAIRERYSS